MTVYVVLMHTFIGTREAATVLATSRREVLRFVESGALVPVAKLPAATGAYLFDPADVERLAYTRKETSA